jgi:cobalt-zinc-cadmium efflux system membrane fusion protein
MRAIQFGLILALITYGTSCQRTGSSSNPESRGSDSGVQPAQIASNVEGMCAEHGVLEAVCTKCNPRLIPIFQAKGDWCAEHEFPESFCPVCHPERGGKPSTDVATDDAPPNGLRVVLQSSEVVTEAGIRTAQVVSGGEAGTIIATATIVADNAKSAQVNARAPGVIRSFKVELGSLVAKGAPLAVIASASVADSRARLRAARARATVAEASRGRESGLYDRGISAQKEVQSAEQAYEEAEAEVAAALAALEMVGADDGESGAYELRAPIGGVVTKRNFTVGTLVGEEEPIFEIIDTSSLWAEIDIPESQAGQVSVGQRVVLKVDALGDREFIGSIRYLAPLIDPQTRTIRARAALANPNGTLRANMYARAHIFASAGTSAVLVPRSAVQEAKGVQVVFVPVSDHEFETRRVRTSPSDGELLAVTEGLRAGETVVTDGSFLLKTETLKESIGAGCCDAVESK